MESFFEFGIYLGVGLAASVEAYVNYINLTLIIAGVIMALMVGAILLLESQTHLMKMNDREGADKAFMFYSNTQATTFLRILMRFRRKWMQLPVRIKSVGT